MNKHRHSSGKKHHLFQELMCKWQLERQARKFDIKPLPALALGAAAMVGAASIGVAQDAPQEKQEAGTAKDTTMPEVLVTGVKDQKSYKTDYLSASKYTGPLRDTPQTVTVVSKDVIREQGAASLREVLRNVPGISIQAGEGGVPAGDQMTIRGFSARTDIFIDGVRDFGGYSRDPFNVAQVEVSKGPASAYNGRGSTGGSINMVSKKPELKRSYEGSAGIGTDQYQRYTIDINEPIKALPGTAVRVNALYHTNEIAGRDIVENNRWGVAPSVAFGIGSPTRVNFDYFHLEQDNVPDYGIPWVPASTTGPLKAYSDQPAPTSWSNWYGLKDRDYERTKTDILTAKLEHDISDELTLRNQTRYGVTSRDSIITAPRFSSINTNALITRTDWKSRDQVTSILNNQTDATIKFKTLELEHTLVPGIEISREIDSSFTRIRTGSNSSTTSLYDPNPDDPYLENIVRTGQKNQTVADTVGIYAFDTVKLNEQWELNGGLRYDYLNIDFVGTNSDGSYASHLGRIDRTLSWRAGIVHKPVEEGSIYAAYGTSFNPSAEGLATSALVTTATSTSNLNLDPEKTETYEIGTKWDLLKKKLGVALALFHTKKTNARTEDTANPSDIAVLEGEQIVNGMDLSLNGRITDKWNVFAGWTYLLGYVKDSKTNSEIGNELQNTPRNSLNLWTTYDLPRGFQVGAGAQYVGERYTSNANTREMPEYWVSSAMLSYKVNKNVTLRMNINNLGDAEYIDASSGGHFIPAPGRTATLTTEFKF